jgi:hypothetical protein
MKTDIRLPRTIRTEGAPLPIGSQEFFMKRSDELSTQRPPLIDEPRSEFERMEVVQDVVLVRPLTRIGRHGPGPLEQDVGDHCMRALDLVAQDRFADREWMNDEVGVSHNPRLANKLP